MLLKSVAMSAIGFFFGSLMVSYFLPKVIKGVDVREVIDGDGNPGSSNAILAAGLKIGLFCMALDVLKAFIPVYIAIRFLNIGGFYLVPVMLSPVLGHAFSPFLGFRGGKAISTIFGSLLAVFPISHIVLLLAVTMAFYRFVVVIQPDSAGVIISMITAAAAALFLEPVAFIKLAFVAMGLVVIYKVQGSPNPGDTRVSVWRYTFSFQKDGLRFHKI